MPPFEDPAEAPAGPPFGDLTPVPKVEPKDSFEKSLRSPKTLPLTPPKAFFEPPSEPATCSECRAKHFTSRILSELPRVPECPAPGGFPPDVARVAICLRVPSENLPPGALRAATCPETPEYLPEKEPECAATRVPGECPRMPPVAPRVPSRGPPGSPRTTPEDPLPGTRRVRRVSHPGSEFSVKSRKFQKMVLTSKIHRN